MFSIYKPLIITLIFLFIRCNIHDKTYLEKHLPESTFRGVWVTNVGSDAIKSEADIKALVSNCKKYLTIIFLWWFGIKELPNIPVMSLKIHRSQTRNNAIPL